ncbi:MAG: GNAT family N-acetyltransferase [Oligoflexia bacterium]|nr:GNAT family N-acetyltransferase [Oligoflexia bacterium]
MEKLKFKEIIETKRLIIRKYQQKRHEEIFNIIESERKRLEEFLPWTDLIKAPEDELKFIRQSFALWKKGTTFNLMLISKDTNEFVGGIGIFNIKMKSESCEIGYWLAKEYEGKGLISEAVMALENYLFEIGFYRIEIRCSKHNSRSCNIPKKLGYTQDGILRKDYIENDGVRSDTVIFSKIKDDLKK